MFASILQVHLAKKADSPRPCVVILDLHQLSLLQKHSEKKVEDAMVWTMPLMMTTSVFAWIKQSLFVWCCQLCCGYGMRNHPMQCTSLFGLGLTRPVVYLPHWWHCTPPPPLMCHLALRCFLSRRIQDFLCHDAGVLDESDTCTSRQTQTTSISSALCHPSKTGVCE